MSCGRDHDADRAACIKLVNDISKGESLAGIYLSAWAGLAANEDLRKALTYVAARETSHGEVFARRMCEVGEELAPGIDARALAFFAPLASPDTTDAEKIAHFESAFGGGGGSGEGDFFSGIEKGIDEGAYDSVTANMLRWYIFEERDSGKVLNEAFAACKAAANGNGHVSADAASIMDCMTKGFASLERALVALASG